MRGRGRAACTALLSVAALAGCDGESSERRAALPPAPPSVADACRGAAETAAFGVLCPTLWPAVTRPGGGRLREVAGKQAYLLEAQSGFGGRSPVFHVLFGGQRRPFPAGFAGGGRSLRVTTRRVTTPILRGGQPTGREFVVSRPTRVVGSTRVHGLPAAILRAPPYPTGGIHGGHAIVMWNEDGHGYLVSTHSETSHRAAARAAIQIARSTGPESD